MGTVTDAGKLTWDVFMNKQVPFQLPGLNSYTCVPITADLGWMRLGIAGAASEGSFKIPKTSVSMPWSKAGRGLIIYAAADVSSNTVNQLCQALGADKTVTTVIRGAAAAGTMLVFLTGDRSKKFAGVFIDQNIAKNMGVEKLAEFQDAMNAKFNSDHENVKKAAEGISADVGTLSPEIVKKLFTPESRIGRLVNTSLTSAEGIVTATDQQLLSSITEEERDLKASDVRSRRLHAINEELMNSIKAELSMFDNATVGKFINRIRELFVREVATFDRSYDGSVSGVGGRPIRDTRTGPLDAATEVPRYYGIEATLLDTYKKIFETFKAKPVGGSVIDATKVAGMVDEIFAQWVEGGFSTPKRRGIEAILYEKLEANGLSKDVLSPETKAEITKLSESVEKTMKDAGRFSGELSEKKVLGRGGYTGLLAFAIIGDLLIENYLPAVINWARTPSVPKAGKKDATTAVTGVVGGTTRAQNLEHYKGTEHNSWLLPNGVFRKVSVNTEGNAEVYSGYLTWVPLSPGKTVVNLECTATLGPKSTGKVVHGFPALVPSGNISNLGEGQRDLSNPDLIPLNKECFLIADYGGLKAKVRNVDEKDDSGKTKPYLQDAQSFKISVVYQGNSYSIYAGISDDKMELVTSGTYSQKTELGKTYAPLLLDAVWKGRKGESRDLILDITGGEVLW